MAQPTNSSLKKHIAILGGSYGGISTAHYLLRHVLPRLPRPDDYHVVLVSPSTQAMCRQACPRALISDSMFPQHKLFADIPPMFEPYAQGAFSFLHGTATALDHVNRTVTINMAGDEGVETLHYHAVVVATGASTPSPLLGLNSSSEHLRQSWAAFRDALPAAKTIVVAGGGPAGVETAGELGEYLNGRPPRRLLLPLSPPGNPKVAITLVTSAPEILPALRPAVARRAEGYLARVGVTVRKGVRVSGVRPAAAGAGDVAAGAAVVLDGGEVLDADLYIPATGTRPNTGFVDAGLLLPDGRLDTNPSTLRVDSAGPRTYAVGDVSSYARPAVHNVLAAVPVLCANLRRDLLLASETPERAEAQDRLFAEDPRENHLVPVGRSKGVGAVMGHQLSSFLVWMIKGRDYWLWTTGNLWSGKQWAKES
ncbi:FAD/NAD(P)-binding domain-containing protein [Colletotrichum zoysiae]|uniref:FAD/NAD(P)-binding domain-containing protein n=1 Tax=Colletotrichum zoysiae TaxID=1216348 RepID=A0AAD9H5K7_9PEZI|nr:FAD/NAD(P)-binding domain-containing protein [Colletotrichum zoysiae]